MVITVRRGLCEILLHQPIFILSPNFSVHFIYNTDECHIIIFARPSESRIILSQTIKSHNNQSTSLTIQKGPPLANGVGPFLEGVKTMV